MIIFIYEEDLIEHQKDTLNYLFRFLEVDEWFEPTGMDKRVNSRKSNLSLFATYYSKSKTLGKVVSKIPILRTLDFPKITVSQEEIMTLTGLYAEENQKLEELLDRELTIWKHE